MSAFRRRGLLPRRLGAHGRGREAVLVRLIRSIILKTAGAGPVARFVRRHGFNLGARRFVAGESEDEFFDVARALDRQGFRVACGLLGEDVRERDEASRAARDYERILDRIAAERLQANVALKLTQLGLAIDHGFALDNVLAVARTAARHGSTMRMDMEDSSAVDATLKIYRELRASGMDNVGAVLQSYLYRSTDDLHSLLPLRPNLRIVKGAYLESPAVAFPRKRDVDANYIRLMETSLREGGFTAIATHDERIIDHAIAFVGRHAIAPARFEFQMLYGVRARLQAELVERGYPVRIAVPFGAAWYKYLVRRVAERPANLAFVVRNLWRW